MDTLAGRLHNLLNELGYDRCGGYEYKKVEGDLTFHLDNPFDGWFNEEDEQDSFILDFCGFVVKTPELGYKTSGKVNIEMSILFKDSDGPGVIQNIENDLRTSLNRLLNR